MNEYSLTIQCVFEFLGTMIMILLGCGVVACVSLKKSKGEGGTRTHTVLSKNIRS